jgi:hypothetical protein
MRMTTTTACVFMTLAGSAWAGENSVADYTVHVYVLNQMQVSSAPGTLQAGQYVASQLLADAGVRLVWHYGKPAAAGPDVLEVMFAVAPASFRTPEKQNVLAYARPYAPDGTPLVFFTDRIVPVVEPFGKQAYQVLGHVLAHEITHVLEGMSHHSEEGLMRARWSPREMSVMTHGTLRMDAIDRELVQIGMEKRMGRNTTDSTR